MNNREISSTAEANPTSILKDTDASQALKADVDSQAPEDNFDITKEIHGVPLKGGNTTFAGQGNSGLNL